jgi:ribosomal peptide maturation radical SAM protein 1
MRLLNRWSRMDVVFVVAPFADINRPAIGVSLLQSEIRLLGFDSRIEYFNLSLAELIGCTLYQRIANGFAPDLLLGEWFFADAVFGDAIPHEDQYITKILSRFCASDEIFLTELSRVRALRNRFLNDCVARIVGLRPKVVGFSTTFHQTCSCLALAKRLKAMANAPVIIFGGANCEGEMGLQLIRSFPYIDYVCSGESDNTLPILLEKIFRKRITGAIPGALERGAKEPAVPEAVKCMDDLPIPDFADYFDRVRASVLEGDLSINLQIEMARGCWWGAKRHCTFCGLNGDTMSFRSKSPERAFNEISYLSKTYGVSRISCVDNILDFKYLTTLFPRLKKSGLDLELFFEVKANLRRDQLMALREGGVRSIQPGIESFSDEVLRLMHKGCTGLQNIQLLRWCEELGIEVAWNILAGFPGESISEYDRMVKLLPLLTHLSPPACCTPVRLDRFSPFFSHHQDFELTHVRPAPAYFYVFPLTRRELYGLAYFFDFDYSDGRKPATYLLDLQREVQRWWKLRMNESERRPKLDAQFSAEGLLITDMREVATASRHYLTGIAAEICFLCDAAKTPNGLLHLLGSRSRQSDIHTVLAELQEANLLFEEGQQYVSLTVFRDRPEDHPIYQSYAPTTIAKAARS